jgi:hypothetical protein
MTRMKVSRTDIEWVRHATNVFRFLMPGEV